jgi:hypothetical protein
MSEILKNFDQISTEMGSAEMPVDANGAQASIKRHQAIYPIIASVSAEHFEKEIHTLRERVLLSGAQQNGNHKKNNHLQNGSHQKMLFTNPDLLSVFPHLMNLLKSFIIARLVRHSF